MNEKTPDLPYKCRNCDHWYNGAVCQECFRRAEAKKEAENTHVHYRVMTKRLVNEKEISHCMWTTNQGHVLRYLHPDRLEKAGITQYAVAAFQYQEHISTRIQKLVGESR